MVLAGPGTSSRDCEGRGSLVPCGASAVTPASVPSGRRTDTPGPFVIGAVGTGGSIDLAGPIDDEGRVLVAGSSNAGRSASATAANAKSFGRDVAIGAPCETGGRARPGAG